MFEQNNDEYKIVERLLKEIRILENEVESQAYISGLWIRHYQTLKKLAEVEFPGTALHEAMLEGVKESKSWEDINDWVSEAKSAENEFFERIEADVEDVSDLEKLKSEVNFLKGVVRALLSTREMKLETILTGYKEWNSELNREIGQLLEHNNLMCEEL